MFCQTSLRHFQALRKAHPRQSEFFAGAVQDRNHKNGDESHEHASEGRNRHGNHDIGAPSCGSEYRKKSQDGRGRGHEGRANPPESPYNSGFPDLLDISNGTGGEALVQKSRHKHAVVRGNAEKGKKAYPDGNTEVDGVHLEKVSHGCPENVKAEEPFLSIEPNHDETAGPCHKDAGKDHQGGREGSELEVQDNEDDKEGQR